MVLNGERNTNTSGTLQNGLILENTASDINGFYINSEISLKNSSTDINPYAYGYITDYNSTTKTFTADWFQEKWTPIHRNYK